MFWKEKNCLITEEIRLNAFAVAPPHVLKIGKLGNILLQFLSNADFRENKKVFEMLMTVINPKNT